MCTSTRNLAEAMLVTSEVEPKSKNGQGVVDHTKVAYLRNQIFLDLECLQATIHTIRRTNHPENDHDWNLWVTAIPRVGVQRVEVMTVSGKVALQQ